MNFSLTLEQEFDCVRIRRELDSMSDEELTLLAVEGLYSTLIVHNRVKAALGCLDVDGLCTETGLHLHQLFEWMAFQVNVKKLPRADLIHIITQVTEIVLKKCNFICSVEKRPPTHPLDLLSVESLFEPQNQRI